MDKVHDLMDEVAEQQEIASEIGEAISNPVGFGQDMDEVCYCYLEILDMHSQIHLFCMYKKQKPMN